MTVALQSQVPPAPIEALVEQPFVFEADGKAFQLKPLSLKDYLILEKEIHLSVWQMYFSRFEEKDVMKSLLPTGEGIKRVRDLLDIILKLMDPIPFYRKMKWVLSYNLKQWFAPKRWVLTLREWMKANLSMGQVIALASYFVRYCSEIKKKLLQILQTGIGSVTKDPNQTTSASHGASSKWDSLSPGPIPDL